MGYIRVSASGELNTYYEVHPVSILIFMHYGVKVIDFSPPALPGWPGLCLAIAPLIRGHYLGIDNELSGR